MHNLWFQSPNHKNKPNLKLADDIQRESLLCLFTLCKLPKHCIISSLAFRGGAVAGVSLGGASQLPGDTCLRHMLLGMRWAGVEGSWGGWGGERPTITPSCCAACSVRHTRTLVSGRWPKKETTVHK